MKIKIKRIDAFGKLPTRGTTGAAGYDLYASRNCIINPGETVRVPLGIAMEIPEGYCGVVYSRSSVALLGLTITPLIIDSDYRGEVCVVVQNTGFKVGGEPSYCWVNPGDRIAQLRIERANPEFMEIVETDELSTTDRGDKGWGSTGK